MSIDKSVKLFDNGDYWRVSFYDQHGRRRFKSIGPKAELSKREAQRAAADFAEKLAVNPTQRNARRASELGPWLDHYLTLRTDLGDQSMVWHRLVVSRLKDFLGTDTKMDRITRDAAARFQVHVSQIKRHGHEIAAFTVHKHMVVAREIFGYALRLDATALNPFDRLRIRTPKMAKDWPYITHEETAAMLAETDSDAWRCLIALCRWAGLRRGEAMRLTWGDIAWDDRVLTVRPEGGRVTTKQGLRKVPIQPRLMTVLQAAYDAAPEGATRVCPISNNNVERQIRALAKRAGVTLDDKPLHTLRKNLETDWLAEHPVLDVTAWLGNSPSVAAKHYNRTKPETIAKVTGEQSEVDRLRAELAALKAKLGQETV